MTINILVFVLGLLVGLIVMGIYTLVKVSRTMMTLIDDYREMLDSYNKSVDTPLEVKAYKFSSEEEINDFMKKIQSQGANEIHALNIPTSKQLERKLLVKRIKKYIPDFIDNGKHSIEYLITVLEIYEDYEL